MYYVTVKSKESNLTFKVKSGQQARSLAKIAVANGFTYEVTYRPEARKIEFQNL